MAEVFKVKYKEREALARALRREIVTKGLVADGALKKGIRIAAEGTRVNLNGIFLTIVAPYYYQFNDSFVYGGNRINLWNGGVIDPLPVTEDWLKQSKTKEILSEITNQYIQWRADKYGIFEGIEELSEKVRNYIGFEFYGDDSGKWNLTRGYKQV